MKTTTFQQQQKTQMGWKKLKSSLAKNSLQSVASHSLTAVLSHQQLLQCQSSIKQAHNAAHTDGAK